MALQLIPIRTAPPLHLRRKQSKGAALETQSIFKSLPVSGKEAAKFGQGLMLTYKSQARFTKNRSVNNS